MPVNVPVPGTVAVNDHVAPPSVDVPLRVWSDPLPESVFPDIVKVPELFRFGSPVFAWVLQPCSV